MSGVDELSKTLGELTAGVKHVSQQVEDLGRRNAKQLEDLAQRNALDHERVRDNVRKLFDRGEDLSREVAANGQQARSLKDSLEEHFKTTDERHKALAADIDKLKSAKNRQIGWLAGAASVGSVLTAFAAWFVDRFWTN